MELQSHQAYLISVFSYTSFNWPSGHSTKLLVHPLAPRFDRAVKSPQKTPAPTLCRKVLPIPERESTEAGDIFRYHGPCLTQGHGSMTADMFDAGTLHRGFGALVEEKSQIHARCCYLCSCKKPPSEGPPPIPYRWPLSLSFHRFIFRLDRTSI